MNGPAPVLAGLCAGTLAVVVGMATGLYGDVKGPLASLELATVDARFALRGPITVDDPVCLVPLDDASMRRAGERLERRAGIAELVGALRAAGTRAIAIDALFPDAERILPEALVRDMDAWLTRHGDKLIATPAPPAAPEDRALRDARDLLLRARAEANGDVTLADAFRGIDVLLALHAGSAVGTEQAGAHIDKAAYGQQIPGPQMPPRMPRVMGSLPAFQDAAAGLGVITVDMDRDEKTVRAVQLARTVDGRMLMPFGVAIAAAALEIPRARLAYDAEARVLHLGDRAIAADPGHRLTLNHRGDLGAFCSVPAARVLDGEAGAALRGKVAIVSYTYLGSDAVRTPLAPQLPGAAIHATMASNLLRGDPLTTAPVWGGLMPAVVLGVLGASVFAARVRMRLAGRVALVLLGALVWVIAAYTLFARGLLVVPVAGPLLALIAASVTALVAAYGAESVQRLRLRRAFAHYLADDVIEEILRNPRALTLGGERRNLTVLFSDIRGFTSMSEELDPRDLVQLLNGYFTPMTRAVLEHRGLLDKYVGDALVAVFGAPLPRADHVDDALGTVLTMSARLRALQRTDALLGRTLEVGVGLNTGDVVVGNMGSAERFDYTVAGDAVNLASRIEGLTRMYGVFCLVGEATRSAASPQFRFRDVDLVRVKGKRQPVVISELLGDDARSIVDYADLPSWQAGVEAYREGRFEDARQLLSRFAAQNPHDCAAPVLLARLQTLHAAPEGWDGVFEHSSK